jgi:chromosome segregation protein
VFLRSLSARGFKSFADRTTLEVEPGITVIVGPNGSGKSNVVDALAWVLGTHSAKKVRGGSMSDVIFAGSPQRSRAGHARVEIVIDNRDGQLAGAGPGTAASAASLPEVRLARTIHADGESTYEINGEEVRALDVQELLSDTGLGRELHTIVGQGQLDEILNARPEERRRYIEEAAGILKHRRRRERALRKLEQVDGHIEKLRTVLRELRRQLRPLERQAEAADRYHALQAELRETRLHLAAAELARLIGIDADAGRRDADDAAEEAAYQRRRDDARARVAALEAEVRRAAPHAEEARSTFYRLTSLAERLRGTSDLVEARRRHLVEYVEEPIAGRPPEELRSRAELLEAERDDKAEVCEAARSQLQAATGARRESEQARRAHEQQRAVERRRRAEARERVVRWEGEVSALRGSIAAAEAELGRVSATLEGLDSRVTTADADVAAVQEEIQRLDVAEVELTARLESAEAEVAERSGRLAEIDAELRDLDGRRSSAQARSEALRAALAETDAGPAALIAEGRDGVLGVIADHVRVDGDAAAAVAAALGGLDGAVVVDAVDDAAGCVAWLRHTDAGAAVVLVADDDASSSPPTLPPALAEAGARPLAGLLTPASDTATARRVTAAVGAVVADTYLVADWSSAVQRHREHPGSRFVTPEGDIAGPDGFRAGGPQQGSSVLTATAADEADAEARRLDAQVRRLQHDRDQAAAHLQAAEAELRSATERINESDAGITGAAERLARLNKELHALANQREIVAAQHRELRDVVDRDRSALSELNSRGPADEPAASGDDEVDDVAAELDEAVDAARDRELDARVAVERETEQLNALERQAAGLRREADEVEEALAEAARRRQARRRGIERCGELALVARTALDAVTASIDEAAAERDAAHQRVDDLEASLRAARTAAEEAGTALDAVRERRHAAELRRQDVTARLASLHERLRTELAVSAEDLAADHPDAAGYDVDELTAREDELVRKVGLLGRVNPLALEEFRALEERHAFLSGQLDDLRRSKRDLADVVVAVDERIRQVFREAFDDVAREFAATFETVFPGGHGELVLTEPNDLLATGIEVHARPPGKKVTRLSLLSGGERSLTVLAFVFAIFRARPSPFYVLDEVDAALDDVNLQRLLRVIRSFRGHAQIIMVTHQKRSMEIADVLYGVTMGPDAVTRVVTERLTGTGQDGGTVTPAPGQDPGGSDDRADDGVPERAGVHTDDDAGVRT